MSASLSRPGVTRKAEASPTEAQKIAVYAVVALTDCDRAAAIAFIRRLCLAGITDPKRPTF